MTTLATLIFLVPLAAGLLFLVIGLRRWRLARAEARLMPEVALPATALAATAEPDFTQRMETLLSEQERRLSETMANLRDDLSDLKSDIEWLAGERMIEQAIALARAGTEPEVIGAEMGMTADQARTIAAFRKH